MRIELIGEKPNHRYVEGENALDIVQKLGSLRTQDNVEGYMAKVRKRFAMTYGQLLCFKDCQSFLEAIDRSGKFLRILKK